MVLTPKLLLKGAMVVAAFFLVLLIVAYSSPGARWADASALQGFLDLQRPRVSELTTQFARIGNPLQVGVIGLTLAGIALARSRPRHALFVVALLAATSISSQLLKALLAYPRYEGTIGGAHISPEAFPSGHATAAMALAIAFVVVMPARLRPGAAIVGVGLALGVGYSIVSMGWHFPSDVGGGYLLATGWAFILLAGLRAAENRYPEKTGRGVAAGTMRETVDRVAAIGLVAVIALAGVVLFAVVSVVIVFRLDDVVSFVQDHTAFSVVAIGLALAAMALLSLLLTALQRRA